MTREKNLDADKKPQDQFDNERLSKEELDGVAGGVADVKIANNNEIIGVSCK